MPSRSTCTGCAGSSRPPASRSSRCAASGYRIQKTRLGLKLALFADIHSNLEAITACLAHAEALGRGPLRVSRRPRRLRRRPGRRARPDRASTRRTAPSSCSATTMPRRSAVRTMRSTANALAAVDWTRAQLGAAAARVPRVAAADRRGRQHPVRPRERRRARAVDLHHRPARGGGEHARRQRDYVFSGHVHEQKLYYTGASGQADAVSARSRDADPRREASPLARDRRLGRPAARRQQRGLLRAVRHASASG